MGNITFKRILILMLIFSHSITPFISSLSANTNKKSCCSSSDIECCSSEKAPTIDTCKTHNGDKKTCKVTGCCEIDYNTAKDGNTTKPIPKINLKKIETLNARISLFPQISESNMLLINNYMEPQFSLLPSYTTSQLLTVSLLC